MHFVVGDQFNNLSQTSSNSPRKGKKNKEIHTSTIVSSEDDQFEPSPTVKLRQSRTEKIL